MRRVSRRVNNQENGMEHAFEETIIQLTAPINGQYPRPWMTKLTDPCHAKVFIVGKNQAKGYPVGKVGRHNRHIDALFNRNGESCRGLYDEITNNKPSPTRLHTDELVRKLEDRNVKEILETNVICYSTPMSNDLRLPGHMGGSKRGEEIFRYLLHSVKPKVIIVHGAGAVKRLSTILDRSINGPSNNAGEISSTKINDFIIVTIRSLAPPEYNKWSAWAPLHLDAVADFVEGNLL